MIRRLALVLALLLGAHEANAVCVTLPYTLTNGTLADAAQVMANFTALTNCVNAPLTIFGTQPAHYVLAGPTSGGNVNPAFRQLSTADLSDIATFNLNTSGTLKTTNATASSSSTTGAVTITGGLGVQGNANIGSALGVGGIMNVSGVTSIAAATNINLNGNTVPALSNEWVLATFGANNAQAGIASIVSGVGHNASFVGVMARGTGASPSGVHTNDLLVAFGAGGYGATQYFIGSGGMFLYATENWTDTKVGTEIGLSTVAIGAPLPPIQRLVIRTGLAIPDAAGADPTGGDPGAGKLNVAGGFLVNNAGIASCSVVTAGATITITGGIVTAFTGC